MTADEVESALPFLKLGRSKGADSLNAEHHLYGGKTVVLWLRKIFNQSSPLKRFFTVSRKVSSSLFTREREKIHSTQ